MQTTKIEGGKNGKLDCKIKKAAAGLKSQRDHQMLLLIYCFFTDLILSWLCPFSHLLLNTNREILAPLKVYGKTPLHFPGDGISLQGFWQIFSKMASQSSWKAQTQIEGFVFCSHKWSSA